MYKINNFKGIKHHKFPVSEEFQTETSEEAVISLCKGSEDLATTKTRYDIYRKKVQWKTNCFNYMILFFAVSICSPGA